MKETLVEKAKTILKNNNQGGFTIPCEGLYPFQWNWDSGFIAVGLAHIDIELAKEELQSLLDAQWENGFIPHIVFHNDSDSYFPGPDFHLSKLHKDASKKYRTTGMTQPPVLGFVLQEMYRIAEDKEATLKFIDTIIDKIYKKHEYLYNNRDPKNEGLVYIWHNWESGTDNSPIWDEVWETMSDIPQYTFERKDTTHIDASQRPSNKEYNYYIHLIEVAKAGNYEESVIAEKSPFLIQDPLFNAMLLASNEALIDLYKQLGREERISQLEEWTLKTKQSLNEKLFDEELGAYMHYDLRNEKRIQKITSSSYAPLFSSAPEEKQLKLILESYNQKFATSNLYACASFDPTHEDFNPKKYWRGPIWVNLNWLIYKGLLKHNQPELANNIKTDTIELIEKFGFYEYFNPHREISTENESNGCGGVNFSWSAALILDILKA
ncbi:Trehalase [Mesonia phycicola]|uniref:Trehalase n=1 Tax=Mesonia phycicola TaxID=579105 RepID=A0A1M6FJS2_9FLAO|nr:trehalase family glycosidase [Mesonia phycicola]SHI97872.1 Trehalase [Mesonia phycicola]